MKKFTILFLFLTLACSKNELSEIRYDGTGGISCLVNGNILKPKGTAFGPPNQYLQIYWEQGIGYLRVGFYNKNSNSEWKIVDIVIPNIEYFNPTTNEVNSLVGTYSLSKNNLGTYDINVYDDFPTYTTTENYIGELVIEFHDTENYIISGTFWFDAVNENGEVVQIRNGRFDKKINNT
jgi:hypothetical protein